MFSIFFNRDKLSNKGTQQWDFPSNCLFICSQLLLSFSVLLARMDLEFCDLQSQHTWRGPLPGWDSINQCKPTVSPMCCQHEDYCCLHMADNCQACCFSMPVTSILSAWKGSNHPLTCIPYICCSPLIASSFQDC